MATGNGQELDKRFTHHPPVGGQVERYEEIRAAARNFAEHVLAASQPSREQALALTKIEEAMMWANAGIARNG